MLSGTYYFREVLWQVSSSQGGALSEAAALYGTISFTGTGTYTISGNLLDLGGQTNTPGQTFSGTYAISSGGFGYLTHPLLSGVQIRGMVSNGIFIGSATENGTYNDLFIAAQLASPAPGLSSFSGNYSMAYMNYSDVGDPNSPEYFNGAQFTLSPNGAGSLGTVSMRGYYAGNGTTVTGQVANSVKYIASNGALVLTFPAASQSTLQLVNGQEYLYQSADGNFVFGGSPVQADMMIGVRTTSGGAPQLLSSSLYFDAGIYSDASQLASGYLDLDSYYGSLSLSNGTLIQHSRIFSPVFTGEAYSSISTGTAPTTAGATYSDPYDSYTIGNGGNVRIGFGVPPYLGIDVALAAPSPTQTGSVYLNPDGVVNAASYAPFTSGISAGELIYLSGKNLASSTQIATTAAFPTTGLNNVQVLIDGLQAPIYYVSPTQIAAIVPYAAYQFPLATIQVNNNGTLSNKITEYVYLTTPGVFTYPVPNGISDAAAVRYDSSGNPLGIVTETNRAEPGDTVAIFLTGLGTVFPPLTADGQPGASSTLNTTVQTIAADLNGTAATVTSASLAPGYAGLYQLNITIPAGLTAGDNYLDIEGPDSYSSEALLPIGNGTASVPARAEVQDGQTYKSSKHRKPQPLKKPIVHQPIQP